MNEGEPCVAGAYGIATAWSSGSHINDATCDSRSTELNREWRRDIVDDLA